MRLKLTILMIAGLYVTACDDPADDVPKAEVEDHDHDEHDEHDDHEDEDEHDHGHDEHMSRIMLNAGENNTIAFTASKVTRSHDGGFNEWTGYIDLDAEHLGESSLNITIQTASIFTDESDLTDHLKNPDFFGVEQFPTATFVSSRIAEGGEGSATHTITGDLTMHGVTKSVTFPATVSITDQAVTARAEFSINRRDWNINYDGMANDLIRDGVVIKLNINASRAGAQPVEHEDHDDHDDDDHDDHDDHDDDHDMH